MKIKSSPELDEKIISLYKDGNDTYQIAELYNCSQTFIMNCLKRHNIARRTTKQYTTLYIPNEKFFDIIDSEEKAYFLGLMYADGNNYIKEPHSYEMSIKLQERDKIILEKFRDLISPQSVLKLVVDKRTGNNHYLFKINSKTICDQLFDLGCVNAKSLILTFPKFLDKKLHNHFIRGYSDGDGSIYSRKPTKSGYINYTWKITSTKQFCDSVSEILQQKLNCNSHKTTPSKDNENQITTSLSVGGNLQVMKILDWLYDGSTICLPRKYDRYLKLISNQNKIASKFSIGGNL